MKQAAEPRFLVDFMLGKLCKWLRILGYDAVYSTKNNKLNLILQSLKENRIILTRDNQLSRKRSWKLILITSDEAGEQLKQVIKELGLEISKKGLFTRCSVCNGRIKPVENKEVIMQQVPEYIYQTHADFSRCEECGKIYWSGTHYGLLVNDLQKLGVKFNDNNKNNSK
jgi:uncharacterized protein